jgi:Cu+-exporting ATPase
MIPCGDCHVDAISRNVDLTSIDIEGVKVAYLSVEGMGCANCATRVRNGVLRLNGFLAASVSLEEESAVVAYDPREVTLQQLLRAVNKSGTGGKHRYWPNLLSVLSGREALPRLMQQKM